MNTLFRTLPVVLAVAAAMSCLRSEPVPVTVRLPEAPWNAALEGGAGGPVWAGGNRYLFFVSDVPDLVADDANGPGLDLVRWDRMTGKTELVTVAHTPGVGANHAVSEFSVSADGQRVAFVTDASNLVAGDENGASDVFVRDLEAGTTTLVSWNADLTGPGRGASFSPVLSADGRRVVYGTLTSNVLPNALPAIGSALCIRDVETRGVTVVGDWTGSFLVNGTADVIVSPMGEWVPPEPGTTPTTFMLWREASGRAERIVLPVAFGDSPSRVQDLFALRMTPSGDHLAFFVPGISGSTDRRIRGLWRVDLRTGEFVQIWSPENWAYPLEENGLSISDDGMRVAFLAAEQGEFTEGAIRIWTEGKGLQTLSEIAASGGGGTTEVRRVSSLQLSPEGSRLLYSTAEAVAEAGAMEPGTPRAFLRELGTGVTRVVAVEESDLDAAFDASGEFLAFAPQENGDEAASLKMLEATAAAPVEILSPVSATAPVTSAASLARVISLSDDGRRVLYRSNARDLVSNTTFGLVDTYVFDSRTGSNQLVNVTRDGSATHDHSALGQGSVLSADGGAVAFRSRNTNVVESVDYAFNAYLRILDEGRTILASPKMPRSSYGVSGAFPLEISGDGRRLAFRWDGPRSPVPIFSREQGGYLPGNWPLSPPDLTQFVISKLSSDGSRVGFGNGPGNGWFDYQLRATVSTFALGGSYLYPVHTPSQGRWMVIGAPNGLYGSAEIYRVDPAAARLERRISSDQYRVGNLVASGDGSTVVCSGRAVPPAGSIPTQRQIFSVAMDAGGVELISVGVDGSPANGDCRSPQVSGDGRFVVFTSFASNLVAGDTNGFADVFVRDRYAGVTHLLSRRDDRTQENGACAGPAISGDGRVAAFTTFGTRLISGDPSREPTVVKVSVPQSSVLDADGDGLPDVWEQDHFGSLTEGVAGDSDGDGLTNLDEYRAHTSPVDGLSRLEMAGGRRTANGVELDWYGHAGVTYQLEQRESLAVGAAWVPVGEPVNGYEGLVHQEVSGSSPGAFFRVSVTAR